MDRATKEARVAEFQEFVGSVASLVITSFSGMKVDAQTALRKQLRDAGAGYKVIKNTLFGIAVEGTPFAGIRPMLTGPVGLAYASDENPGAAAKVCLEFVKKNPLLALRGGYVDGQFVVPENLKALSEMPGKRELRARFLGTLVAVPQQFLGVISAVPRDFMGVLAARKAQLEEQA